MRIDSAGFNQPYGVRRLVAVLANQSGDKSPHSTKERRAALMSAAVTGQIEIPHIPVQQEPSHAD